MKIPQSVCSRKYFVRMWLKTAAFMTSPLPKSISIPRRIRPYSIVIDLGIKQVCVVVLESNLVINQIKWAQPSRRWIVKLVSVVTQDTKCKFNLIGIVSLITERKQHFWGLTLHFLSLYCYCKATLLLVSNVTDVLVCDTAGSLGFSKEIRECYIISRIWYSTLILVDCMI